MEEFGPGTVVWWKDGRLTTEPQRSQAFVIWAGELKPVGERHDMAF